MKKLFKKPLFNLIITLSAIFLVAQPAYAQNTEALLKQIRDTTYNILTQINKIPVYLEAYLGPLTEMAESWIKSAEEDPILATNQASFAELAKSKEDAFNRQLAMSLNFTDKYLRAGSFDRANPLPPANGNELNYGIMFQQPLPGTQLPKDPDSAAQNYIINTAGLGVILRQPSPMWKKSVAADNYKNFYNTIAAVKSYNSYVLSGLFKQSDNDALVNKLAQQASNSDWFKTVAEEELGLVLRQILMYDSQIFVQLTRMVRLEEQMLTVQGAMTSMISLSTEQFTGDQLWQKASL